MSAQDFGDIKETVQQDLTWSQAISIDGPFFMHVPLDVFLNFFFSRYFVCYIKLLSFIQCKKETYFA